MSMNWIELDDVNYRQVSIYDMSWERTVPLEHFTVAIAKFGGPIARVLKPKTLLKSDSAFQLSAKCLTIHSASGKLYSKTPWDFEQPLLGLGWTSEEILVALYKNGDLEFYTIWGEKIICPPNLFSPRKVEILRFQVLETTLVMYASDFCFYMLRNLPNCSTFVPELLCSLATPGPASHPTCFLAFSDSSSSSFDMQLIIGLAGGGIRVIGQGQNTFHKVPFSTDDSIRVIDIAISGNSNFLALLQEGGTVLVVPSDLSRLSGKQTIDRRDVKQMIWCGSDALCIVFSGVLGIYGPKNSNQMIEYSTGAGIGVMCLSEIDGLRIITTEKHQFLEKVDKSVEDIFSIGCFSPASLLKTAYELYLSQSSSSGDSVRNLQQENQLLEAVESCMTASCCEFDTENQETLLKTAAFGKTFLPSRAYDSNKFVETVKNLRVLNNIRKPEIARPLTYKELQTLRSMGEMLIRRLLDSHHHYLALQISKLWKLREEPIYIHWACAKLGDQAYTDSEMCEVICSKLSACRQVSYTEIAKKALDCSRKELAIRLLENEPSVSRKVPLLLYMNESQLALDRAIASMDPDLIYLVIMRVHQEEKTARENPDYSPGSSTAMEQVLMKPVAREMMLRYAKQMDEKLLLNANRVLKRYLETGNMYVEKALATTDPAVKINSLTKAQEIYHFYEKDTFYCTCIKEQLSLLERQKKVGKETAVLSISGTSVCDTIYQLLMERHVSAAESIAKAFQVPEKKMWYIKLRVWVNKDEWGEVEEVLKSKKAPPIGFKSFADAAAKKGYVDIAEKCILKVNEPDYQITMLQHIGKFLTAAQVAVKSRNFEVLNEIGRMSSDADVRAFIDNALTTARPR